MEKRYKLSKTTINAFRQLIDDIGGEGNIRYRRALIGALLSSPVRESLEAAIDLFLQDEQLMTEAKQIENNMKNELFYKRPEIDSKLGLIR